MSLESLSDEAIHVLLNFHRELNDAHRQSFDGALGEVNIGGRAADLPDDTVERVRQAIRDTSDFADEIHSSGLVKVDGREYQWVISRYKRKAKTEHCDGKMVGYRSLMIGYREDYI